MENQHRGFYRKKGRDNMENEQIKTETKAVKSALDAWVAYSEQKDNELLPGLVAHDPDLVWIGTGASDWLRGYEALEGAMQTQNTELEALRVRVSDEAIHVFPDKAIAWATNRWTVRATFVGGRVRERPLRCTWILEKRDASWVLVHFHLSAQP
jgi:ketosteroid isomerase-like protein